MGTARPAPTRPDWIGGPWTGAEAGAGAPGWSPPALLGPDQPHALTQSGRAALATCLRALPPGPVLVPAYGCPALAQAVAACRRTPVFHPGDGAMGPAWEALPALVGRHGARCLVLVHPLGVLQDGEALRRLRAATGLQVLEDASHTLLNAPGATCLGPGATDAVAASLRKLLPLAAGGVAALWGRGAPAPGPANPAGTAAVAALAAALTLPPGPARHRAAGAAEGLLERAEVGGPLGAADATALTALGRAGAASWRVRCRENWAQLAEGLRETTCRPLRMALPAGACPLGLAVRSHSRTRLARFLLARGVEATWHWPIAAAARPALTREERLLAGTLLTLPCDGRFGAEGMARVVEACRDFDRSG